MWVMSIGLIYNKTLMITFTAASSSHDIRDWDTRVSRAEGAIRLGIVPLDLAASWNTAKQDVSQADTTGQKQKARRRLGYFMAGVGGWLDVFSVAIVDSTILTQAESGIFGANRSLARSEQRITLERQTTEVYWPQGSSVKPGDSQYAGYGNAYFITNDE
ncbi:uncharacterized protein I303_105832 [Kwoniella dejecticola CBS 10117]|uniref:Uncharacterized protein n=1 Tax=Kwoniella dejecticola CBS 10117 TaxID=1296121 RepID=A0A1A6A0K9_9TREE|nr:uncharacterized protein I303_05853 [Kwoniella dejecticola CBS 10117]OBR83573.1 hypothetical protein I303_05853 [Kwoniella dejecticola CBS 10117]